MAENKIGVAVTADDSNTALASIEDLEKRGFPAVWRPAAAPPAGTTSVSLLLRPSAPSKSCSVPLSPKSSPVIP